MSVTKKTITPSGQDTENIENTEDTKQTDKQNKTDTKQSDKPKSSSKPKAKYKTLKPDNPEAAQEALKYSPVMHPDLKENVSVVLGPNGYEYRPITEKYDSFEEPEDEKEARIEREKAETPEARHDVKVEVPFQARSNYETAKQNVRDIRTIRGSGNKLDKQRFEQGDIGDVFGAYVRPLKNNPSKFKFTDDFMTGIQGASGDDTAASADPVSTKAVGAILDELAKRSPDQLSNMEKKVLELSKVFKKAYSNKSAKGKTSDADLSAARAAREALVAPANQEEWVANQLAKDKAIRSANIYNDPSGKTQDFVVVPDTFGRNTGSNRNGLYVKIEDDGNGGKVAKAYQRVTKSKYRSDGRTEQYADDPFLNARPDGQDYVGKPMPFNTADEINAAKRNFFEYVKGNYGPISDYDKRFSAHERISKSIAGASRGLALAYVGQNINDIAQAWYNKHSRHMSVDTFARTLHENGLLVDRNTGNIIDGEDDIPEGFEPIQFRTDEQIKDDIKAIRKAVRDEKFQKILTRYNEAEKAAEKGNTGPLEKFNAKYKLIVGDDDEITGYEQDMGSQTPIKELRTDKHGGTARYNTKTDKISNGRNPRTGSINNAGAGARNWSDPIEKLRTQFATYKQLAEYCGDTDAASAFDSAMADMRAKKQVYNLEVDKINKMTLEELGIKPQGSTFADNKAAEAKRQELIAEAKDDLNEQLSMWAKQNATILSDPDAKFNSVEKAINARKRSTENAVDFTRDARKKATAAARKAAKEAKKESLTGKSKSGENVDLSDFF